MTTTNEHTERVEFIKGLRDLVEIDFDNLFMLAAAPKPQDDLPAILKKQTS